MDFDLFPPSLGPLEGSETDDDEDILFHDIEEEDWFKEWEQEEEEKKKKQKSKYAFDTRAGYILSALKKNSDYAFRSSDVKDPRGILSALMNKYEGGIFLEMILKPMNFRKTDKLFFEPGSSMAKYRSRIRKYIKETNKKFANYDKKYPTAVVLNTKNPVLLFICISIACIMIHTKYKGNRSKSSLRLFNTNSYTYPLKISIIRTSDRIVVTASLVQPQKYAITMAFRADEVKDFKTRAMAFLVAILYPALESRNYRLIRDQNTMRLLRERILTDFCGQCILPARFCYDNTHYFCSGSCLDIHLEAKQLGNDINL